MERPNVLLAIDGDPARHVQALDRAGFQVTLAEQSFAGTAAVPHDIPHSLAVLDCDLAAEQVTSLYAALHNGTTVPTILLLGPMTELPAGIGAGNADANDEVALKPLTPEALVYRLQALLIRTGRHLPTESAGWASSESLNAGALAGEGHVISIFAPKGGVGKTTIAVNLAIALRQQTRAEVLLFDADVGVGNVSSVIDVPYRLGLADLADSPPSDWTDAAFAGAVSEHEETGVRVMTWGTDPAESERVSVDLLIAALRWARSRYAYVIVDNHPGYDDRTMAMLAIANEIFLVVTPEVGALRNSAQFMELAKELGLASGVRVIVNRANHGIRVSDMASSLNMPVAATVVSNGPKAVIASNEGRPVVLKFPRERIATDLHRLARLITEPEGAEAQPPPKRWWARRLGTKPSHI